jgi:polysaccharide biosynthesis protein PslA
METSVTELSSAIATATTANDQARGAPHPETVRVAIVALTALLDVVALFAGFQATEALRGYQWVFLPSPISLAALTSAGYLYFAISGSSFAIATMSRISSSVSSAWRALLGAIVVVIVCAFFAKFSLKISRSAFLSAVIASGIALIVSRSIAALVIRVVMKERTTAILLMTDRRLSEPADGIDVIDLNTTDLVPDLADPVQMSRVTERLSRYDRVYLHCEPIRRDAWITALKATGVACELVVPSAEIHTAVGIGRLGNFDTLILSLGPLSFANRVQKRLFDLVITVPLLIVLAPVMIATAILIRLESPGPSVFTQFRLGQGNRPFRIYKFRSMRLAASDAVGARSTARDDDRLTRIGRFIRKTSIDELPQLFNVLIGNMSLIGPRPHAVGSRAGEQLFWEVSDLYWMRHALKPGITGLAQIHGYRGATHLKSDLEARLRCDLEYLQSWSMWNDISILLATVKVVTHPNAF